MKLEVGKKYLDGTFFIGGEPVTVKILYIAKNLALYSTFNSNKKEIEGTAEIKYAEKKWKEYTEPKKMVKTYLYAYYIASENRWASSYYFYKNDSQYMAEYKHEIFRRLDYSMIEVEV